MQMHQVPVPINYILTIKFHYIFVIGCIYCNKWQEAQLFEFVPNQTAKTIELKVEKPNLDLTSPFERSSEEVIPNTSENIALSYNQNTTLKDSEIHNKSSIDKNISQNENTNDSCNLNDTKLGEDISNMESDHPVTSESSKPLNQQNKNKNKSKLGFTQMRIDSTVYFDNMGYSYQIQNEKNDKKLVVKVTKLFITYWCILI